MKYTDLTEEQVDHFVEMVEHCGPIPDGATHFDIGDPTTSTWMRKEGNKWYCWLGVWFVIEPEEGEAETDFIKIPEKPWYNPSDVKLEKEEPEQNKPSGSSNSYYWVEIPLDRVTIDEDNSTVGFMLEEYIKYGLGNDFDRGNLAKTNHRIGKKPGNDDQYELDKLQYYAGQVKKNWGK